MTQLSKMTFETLDQAVGKAVAIRAVLRLQPAGGKGSKVFPPTYGAAQDGRDHQRFGQTKYATETRHIDGRDVDCVLLDSVASQANRMELALLEAWDDDDLDFPVIRVDFREADAQLQDPVGVITTLDAPHRVYDAILRDSLDDDGVLFRATAAGRAVTAASPRDATGLFTYCPTALVFGAWDSTGPKGGLGSKFPRAIASEIVAIDVALGARVASRIDPLQITAVKDVVFQDVGADDWTDKPTTKKAKSLKPSEVNHGNVTPSRDITNGGVTFDHARQTTVLSLPALRRLRFKVGDGQKGRATAHAAHTALAALGIAGLAHAHALGHDLRSGTLLVGDGPLSVEILGADGTSTAYGLDVETANGLLRKASEKAAAAGLSWQRDPIAPLKPAPKLVALLKASQDRQAKAAPGASEQS